MSLLKAPLAPAPAAAIDAPALVDYGRSFEKEIAALTALVARYPSAAHTYPARWLAIKLLEQDSDIEQQLLALPGGSALITEARLSSHRLQQRYEEDIDVLIADQRYQFIHDLVDDVMVKTGSDLTTTDKIDRIVTHRLLGVPIFLVVMWAVFKLTADVSAPLLDWIDALIGGPVSRAAAALLSAAGLSQTWFASLILDGVIAGVGGVLVFVPVLLSLYLALAVLEDSGYMARAAFVMDGLMSKIGLQGKSFLPMMVGFGCTVPAIYATRTLENEKDRILTALLVPFMSCGARLPVYVLFAAVFFSQQAGAVVFSMYLLGILMAMVLGLLLRHTLFKQKEQAALLMELPAYRWPNWRTVWRHAWERIGAFLRNATTLILATSVILWLLMAIPVRGGSFADTNMDNSLFATVAGATSPVLAPLGFGSWQAGGALISGFVAKEVVVSTIAQTFDVAEGAAEAAAPPTLTAELSGIVTSFGQALIDTVRAVPLIVGIDTTGGGEDEVAAGLRTAVYHHFQQTSGGHGALAGLAFMVFVLLYTPCMVTIAAEKQELGSRWMWFSIVGQFIIAWLMALIVFQGGLLLAGG